MTTIIDVIDLPTAIQSQEMVQLMVDGANARATRVAPCLSGTGDTAPTADQLAEAKLVLVGAIQRWVDAGSGSVQSQTAGPFGMTVDTRQRGGWRLWPSEISDLQAICKSSDPAGIFSVDTAPPLCGTHSAICAVAFGAAYCSCGADLAGFPLYEDVEP